MQKTANCGLSFLFVSPDQLAYAPSLVHKYIGRHGLAKMLRVMRLTIFLLTVAFTHTYAISVAQNVTLSGSNLSLKKIFTAIEKQTEYVVFYNRQILSDTKPVSVSVQDMPIRDFLKEVLKDQQLDFVIQDKTISLSVKKEKNHLPVSSLSPVGRSDRPPLRIHVTDTDGNPLSGASVINKKTKNSGVTDAEGVVSLNFEPGDVIIVSYVGYESQEITVKNTSFLTISLRPKNASLNEVVVVKGYYNTSKVLNTGAVNSIKGEDIAKQPVSDMLMALEGKIPGLYISQVTGVPGGRLNVILRGRNSIANGVSPLYIVDGIPFNSKSLSQNENAALGLSPFTSIRPEDIQSIDVLKDADATAIYGSRGANGVILITTKKGRAGKTKFDVNVYSGAGKVTNKLNLMNTEQFLAMRMEAFKNDNATPQSFDHDVNGDWEKTRYTDWQKVLIGGTAKFTNVNATLSGGNEQTQFLFGTSYRKETTVYPGNYNNRIGSANLNVQHNSENKKLHADISVNYSNNNNRLPFTDFANLIYAAPNAPALYNADGTLNWQNSTFDNPFGLLQQKSTSVTENLISNVTLSYNLLKDLQLKSSFGYNATSMNEVNIIPFTRYNPVSTNAANRRSQIRANNNLKSWIIEPQVNYTKEWNGHHFNAIVGATFQNTTQDGLSQTAKGFSSDALIENFAAATTISAIITSNALYKYDAAFARIGYNYKQKYVLNLTGRRDGSSRFGPNKKFGNFGAVGAAWVFTNESFIKDNLSFLSSGKLRGSLGKTGNDQLTDYAYLSTYVPDFGTYFGTGVLSPNNLSNPLYGWETINKTEVALELGILKDRLLLNISYYRNRTSNQLVGYSLPRITGFPSIIANLPAVIQNKGMEFEVSSNNINERNLSWTTSFNLSIPKNKLVSYPNILGSPYATTYFIGQPLTVDLNYEYTGVDPETGLYTFRDIDGDGEITSSGDRVPKFYGQKFFGGLNNSLTYKAFSLDFMLQFVKQIGYSQDINTMAGLYYQNEPTSVLNHWVSTGQLGTFQRYSQNFGDTYTASSRYDNSDARITDASFIRLKNVILAWSLPSDIARKLKVQSLRVYAQGQNLFTITNFKGIDPETALSSRNAVRLPPLRLFTLGMQISF